MPLNISEDLQEALLGLTLKKSSLLPVIHFSVSHAGLTELCWKVLSTTAPQSSCHKANITVKIFSLTRKMCCCHGQGGVDFSLIAHLSPEWDVACQLLPPESVSILFIIYFLINFWTGLLSPQCNSTVMHWFCHRSSYSKYPLTPINNTQCYGQVKTIWVLPDFTVCADRLSTRTAGSHKHWNRTESLNYSCYKHII